VGSGLLKEASRDGERFCCVVVESVAPESTVFLILGFGLAGDGGPDFVLESLVKLLLCILLTASRSIARSIGDVGVEVVIGGTGSSDSASAGFDETDCSGLGDAWAGGEGDASIVCDIRDGTLLRRLEVRCGREGKLGREAAAGGLVFSCCAGVVVAGRGGSFIPLSSLMR
jgi:hypothetical protein